MLSGLLDLVANALVGVFMGAVPERQPWRGLVAALYGLAALAAIGLVVWLVAGAL